METAVLIRRERLIRTTFVATLLIAACLASAVAASAQSPAAPDKPAAGAHGRAYLFRGLIGAIDWGMDELAQRINRAGVVAKIDAHTAWRDNANQAIADYRKEPAPITVIGHSIGGDSAISFAEALAAAHVPVHLLITYDPTRMAGNVPGNVERYLNLYQSSNFLGGGDLTQGRGFHGHYASFNLKDRTEIVHINLDKFDRIQEQLVSKIRSLGATPVNGEGEAVPLRLVPPATGAIELWDSGVPVAAHAGDTLQSVATVHHVPLWAVAQLNQKSEHATLNEGDRVVVPRFLVPRGR